MRMYDVLNSTLNPMMRGFLRSPLHGLMSRNLGILHYKGRRSGRPYAVPLSYVRAGSQVRFLSSYNTRWWMNFKDGPQPAEVEIAKERFSGQGHLITEDGDALKNGVREFLTALPRDAVVYGVGLDKDRLPLETDIQSAAGKIVLVEVELDV